MANSDRLMGIATLVLSIGVLLRACDDRPVGGASEAVADMSQLPGPVIAAIVQRAMGRSVSDIVRKTNGNTVSFGVTLGSWRQKEQLLIDPSGRIVSTATDTYID
ncbi:MULTISPECIES: hypothetical protein [unclassified Burkholderia]|uniref:hypothetical protein n=1 Tax=unclassified Burkholderia TaxID=2613784 RepID=UPI0015888F42|nr:MULTISPECIES: hypothetical protein [unclassified Burkholderia]